MNDPIPSTAKPLAWVTMKLLKDDFIEIDVGADEGQIIEMFINLFKRRPDVLQMTEKARTMYLSHINRKKN